MIEDRKKADNIQRYLFFVQLKLIEGQFSPVTNTKKNTKGKKKRNLNKKFQKKLRISFYRFEMFTPSIRTKIS